MPRPETLSTLVRRIEAELRALGTAERALADALWLLAAYRSRPTS